MALLLTVTLSSIPERGWLPAALSRGLRPAAIAALQEGLHGATYPGAERLDRLTWVQPHHRDADRVRPLLVPKPANMAIVVDVGWKHHHKCVPELLLHRP